MAKKQSKSQELRKVLFALYSSYSLEFRNARPFEDFYDREMNRIIIQITKNI